MKTETVTRTNEEARALLSPEQLADYLGCGRTYVYGLLARGEIPSFKLGKLRRVRQVDVDAYVGQQLAASQKTLPTGSAH